MSFFIVLILLGDIFLIQLKIALHIKTKTPLFEYRLSNKGAWIALLI